MEDRLGIDEPTLREIEINAYTQKLLSQQGYIKMIGVEPRKVAALKLLRKHGAELFKVWLFPDILIGDTSQLLHILWDGLLRIDQLIATLLLSVWRDLNIGYLDDTVLD